LSPATKITIGTCAVEGWNKQNPNPRRKGKEPVDKVCLRE